MSKEYKIIEGKSIEDLMKLVNIELKASGDCTPVGGVTELKSGVVTSGYIQAILISKK